MTGKQSPRGLWIIAALALLWGVGSLSPAWAAEPGAVGDGSGIIAIPPHSSPPGGPGGTGTGDPGEGDPDWWQTDVWTGSEMGALPALESPTADEPRGMLRLVEGPLSAFADWLLQLSGHHLGF